MCVHFRTFTSLRVVLYSILPLAQVLLCDQYVLNDDDNDDDDDDNDDDDFVSCHEIS